MSTETALTMDQKQFLEFNRTIFHDYEVNPWKFLEEMPPSTVHNFLLRSPIPVLSATTAYILFVCFVGPLWMRSREAFQLKTTIRLYNLIEVFLASYLLYSLHNSIGSFGNFFNCSKMFTFSDQSATHVYRMANTILFVRLSEFMDTIFFVLRKKPNQITFLHVFHHSFVPIYAYWILRTAPMRFNCYIIYINSAIHVLMYFYYFLATFQPNQRANGKEKLSNQSFLMKTIGHVLKFKKYVTQLQILQFVSLNCYALYSYVQPKSCGVPGTYIASNFLLATGFLSLFVHFYVSSYKQVRRSAAETAAAAAKRSN